MAIEDFAAEAHLTHQGFRWLNRGLAPLCSACILADECQSYSEQPGAVCAPFEQAHDELVATILDQSHIDKLIDRPLVDEYVRQLLFLRLADLWVSKAGMFTMTNKRGTSPAVVDVQPVLGYRLKAAGHVRRLAETLKLTPSTRAAVQAAAPLTRAIIAIDEERQKEKLSNESD